MNYVQSWQWKAPELHHHWRLSGAFIINFEQIADIALVSLLLTFNVVSSSFRILITFFIYNFEQVFACWVITIEISLWLLALSMFRGGKYQWHNGNWLLKTTFLVKTLSCSYKLLVMIGVIMLKQHSAYEFEIYTEAYLEPSRTSAMGVFCKNIYPLLAVNYFQKKALFLLVTMLIRETNSLGFSFKYFIKNGMF